jgi:hypothetical protein
LATIKLKRKELVLDSEKERPCDNTEASEGDELQIEQLQDNVPDHLGPQSSKWLTDAMLP